MSKIEKKITKALPILGSSTNQESLALSVKGVLVLLVPAVVQLLRSSGVEVLESDLVELIDALFVLAGVAVTVFGLGRKLFVKLKG